MSTSHRPFKKIKKLDQLTATLTLRINETQAQKLEREALKQGRPIAELVRDLIDNL